MQVLSDTGALFRKAADHDPTLAPGRVSRAELNGKRINAIPYNRESLFRNMADGRVSVFKDYPSPLRYQRLRRQPKQDDIVLESYCNSGIRSKIRVKTGPAKTERYLTVNELVEKWRRQRARVNVTDFHFRNTRIEQCINPKRLSQFNLYPECSEDVAGLEMMTLVISSVGGFSDSHSDDSDGSNHCFTGTKLWLAWDTHEGMAAGLEDLDRQDVYRACGFDLPTWLGLESACWFTVETGQTLFMPGHLTHKVVTLEPYLGVGSFYLALPNCLRTLSRWLSHTPNWQHLGPGGFDRQLYPEVVRRICTKLKRLEKCSERARQGWGADFLDYSVRSWKKQCPAGQQKQVLNSPCFDQSQAQPLYALMR